MGYPTARIFATAASDGLLAPLAFRERAKLYLENARGNSAAIKQSEELKKREEEIAALKDAQKVQDEKHATEMAELRSLIAAATAPRRPGRPKKAQTTEG